MLIKMVVKAILVFGQQNHTISYKTATNRVGQSFCTEVTVILSIKKVFSGKESTKLL